jgi:hypothetical protein
MTVITEVLYVKFLNPPLLHPTSDYGYIVCSKFSITFACDSYNVFHFTVHKQEKVRSLTFGLNDGNMNDTKVNAGQYNPKSVT